MTDADLVYSALIAHKTATAGQDASYAELARAAGLPTCGAVVEALRELQRAGRVKVSLVEIVAPVRIPGEAYLPPGVADMLRAILRRGVGNTVEFFGNWKLSEEDAVPFLALLEALESGPPKSGSVGRNSPRSESVAGVAS
jgi:hypothetical protein